MFCLSLSRCIYIHCCQNILLCNKMIQNKYRYTYVKGNLSPNNDKHFCADIGRLQKVNSLASCGVLFLSPSLSLWDPLPPSLSSSLLFAGKLDFLLSLASLLPCPLAPCLPPSFSLSLLPYSTLSLSPLSPSLPPSPTPSLPFSISPSLFR